MVMGRLVSTTGRRVENNLRSTCSVIMETVMENTRGRKAFVAQEKHKGKSTLRNEHSVGLFRKAFENPGEYHDTLFKGLCPHVKLERKVWESRKT